MTERTLEALSKEAQRQLAIVACKNLMGSVMFYGAAWHNKKIVDLWADREDAMLEMPWGIYDGIEGVKRCYLQDFGDRNDPGKEEALKGILMLYSLDTPIVVVAEDGQSAKGVWTTSGAEAWTDGKTHPQAYWRWGKYETTFVKENGTWKILKMSYFPMFHTKYEVPWTEAPADDWSFFPVTPDRERNEPVYHYDGQSVYPENQPSIPQAYKTLG